MKKELIKSCALRAGYASDRFGNGYWDSDEFAEYTNQLLMECFNILNNSEQFEAVNILKREFDIT